MDDTPEPFTHEEAFRLIDFALSIVAVLGAAAVVLVAAPFVAGLIRSYGGF